MYVDTPVKKIESRSSKVDYLEGLQIASQVTLL